MSLTPLAFMHGEVKSVAGIMIEKGGKGGRDSLS